LKSADRAPLRYDATTIYLHWLMALIVVVLWVGAKTLDWFPPGVVRADARSAHVVLGLALGAFGLARLVWRLSFGRPLPPADAGVLGAAATATHRGLYALLAAMVAVGILLVWTSGDSLFNQFNLPPLSADDRALARQLRQAHDVIGWLIVVIAGLHSVAVLFHHYVLRDGVLARMSPRRAADDGA
jgi:cytochrome b561